MILIVLDTVRADRVSIYGAPPSVTPTLARFAENAVVFEHAIAPAPLTMPSTAALLTGLYPHRAGVTTHARTVRFAPPTSSLAESAREAGYTTAAVVANPWLASERIGFDRGFERYETKRSLGLRAERLDAEAVTDAAIEILDRSARPLFLWVHYIDAHMPYQPPRAAARAIGLRATNSRVIEDFVSQRVPRESIYFTPTYSDADLEQTRRLYAASIRAIDDQLARLFDAIERTLGDNVIVVVTADHGEGLGEHGLYFAHDFHLYDELLRVPLLVRAPGVRPARIRGVVSLVDVAPTLCALTALRCGEDLDGIALDLATDVARGRIVLAVGPPRRKRYRDPFIQLDGDGGRWTAARTERWKLIRVPETTGTRWRAYDLRTDPREMRPLGVSEAPAALQRALERWRTDRRSAPPKSAGTKTNDAVAPLAAETIEELRALGYLD